MPVREAALRPLYKKIDALITDKVKDFFEMADGYSDVVVKNGNIEMVNAYAKPEAFNKMLAGKAGLQLEMLHVKSLKLKIPWFNWSAGVDIELDSLLVVVRPLDSDHWSLEEVRELKEQDIVREVEALLTAEKRSEKARKKKTKSDHWKSDDEKPSLLTRLQEQILDSASIRLSVKNVHIRYEHVAEADEPHGSFAAGLVVPECHGTKQAPLGLGLELGLELGLGH